jgi:biopolymer transport protein ExbD/biopolymer transport protein TolR
MKADINVTPLVDIVLVLLIIFIVITPAVSNAVRLPAARHSVPPERGRQGPPLTLVLAARRNPAGQVTGAGPVQVEGREGKDGQGNTLAFDLGDAAGRARLEAFVKAHVASGDPRVFIKADLGLAFRQVNDLLQVCREAGAVEAAVVTREDRLEGA